MALSVKNPPEPKIERIPALVNKISSGDIKIPKFQRGFVWKETQILELLESIYEGYPIGSLLFWLSEKPMKVERDLGGFKLPNTPDRYPRNYVLDGQQRLTTIYGILKWPYPKQYSPLNVYFDLDSGKFGHYKGEDKNTHLPMHILFQTSSLMDFRDNLRQLEGFNDYLQRVDLLLETFQEYLIPVVTIKEKTVEDVCPIFERINSTGTHLDAFDLMVAATWSNNFDLNDQIDTIREKGRLKDFSGLSNSIYLKFLAAIKGFGSKRTSVFKLRKQPASELIGLADRVKKAAEKAIDFLTTELKVPSDDFLPYENQLVVYCYFFSKVKNPTALQMESLQRWFWQCGFSEHYRGATESILEQDLSAIDDLVNGKNDSLMIPFNLEDRDVLKRQFWKTSSFTKTFCVMLARKNPKNITNGTVIDTTRALSVFNSKEFHHIFPKSFLSKLGVDPQHRNNICNVCMLASSENKLISDTPPSDYLVRYERGLGLAAPDIFESNLIGCDESSPWRRDEYDLFLEERAHLILNAIKALW